MDHKWMTLHCPAIAFHSMQPLDMNGMRPHQSHTHTKYCIIDSLRSCAAIFDRFRLICCDYSCRNKYLHGITVTTVTSFRVRVDHEVLTDINGSDFELWPCSMQLFLEPRHTDSIRHTSPSSMNEIGQRRKVCAKHAFFWFVDLNECALLWREFAD